MLVGPFHRELLGRGKVNSNACPSFAAGLLGDSGPSLPPYKTLVSYLDQGETLPQLENQASCKRKEFGESPASRRVNQHVPGTVAHAFHGILPAASGGREDPCFHFPEEKDQSFKVM